MTYAPADLLAIQRYLQAKTGQSWASLGIIHSTPEGGGYHEGEDLLIAADRAPGPQYPGSDYSYTDSPRDLLPTGRLAGGDAASGLDAGGNFPRFLEFNAWMRQRMLAGDPRTRDIREMIYTLDRRVVRRIDRTGKQADGGDSSHLSHTHFSFFRDSLGRRDRDDNFLGLLREFFDGPTQTSEVPDMDAEQNRRLVNLEEREHQIHAIDADELTYFKPAGQGGTIGRTPNRFKLQHREVVARLEELQTAVDAVRQTPPGSVVITDEQFERVLRRVMGSVDGSAPAAS